MTDKPIRSAAKKAATNWGGVAVFGISAATMCMMASNLKDGSELKTAVVMGFVSFAALFVGYWFTGSKQ